MDFNWRALLEGKLFPKRAGFREFTGHEKPTSTKTVAAFVAETKPMIWLTIYTIW
jgi:hypothetical protein